MCLLAVLWRTVHDAPILVAANREERFNRPSLPPRLHPGRPRVVCPVDEAAGGTWLGTNEHGLVVAVTNRWKSFVPEDPRSRGLLCRDLLECPTAAIAVELALDELGTARYAGANFVCVDADAAWVVHAGDRLASVRLAPGLHLLTNADLDDPDDARLRLARGRFEAPPIESSDSFLERAAEVCRLGEDPAGGAPIVLRGPLGGTVSSTLLALTSPPQHSRLLHAPGPPDRTAYQDLSDLLRGCFRDGA